MNIYLYFSVVDHNEKEDTHIPMTHTNITFELPFVPLLSPSLFSSWFYSVPSTIVNLIFHCSNVLLCMSVSPNVLHVFEFYIKSTLDYSVRCLVFFFFFMFMRFIMLLLKVLFVFTLLLMDTQFETENYTSGYFVEWIDAPSSLLDNAIFSPKCANLHSYTMSV